MTSLQKNQVLIIGSGLAGLSCALKLASHQVQVTVVSKSSETTNCNTAWAQGGIAFLDSEPANEKRLNLFKADILSSGDGIGYEPAISQLAELGNRLVKEEMIDRLQIPFDRNSKNELLFAREGAHSEARIIHVGDSTGSSIQNAYYAAACKDKNITLLPNHTAVDLLTTSHNCMGKNFRYRLDNHCCGAYLLNNETNEVTTFAADFTVLATGGVGQLFLHSSNSPGAIGDGLVIAKRAGADLLFPHFIQFHPTSLFKGKQNFLISEVVRGAGATLLNQRGERFMERYNAKQLELAPRDELARAIIQEMVNYEDEFVYLDLSSVHKSEGPLEKRFPTIFAECLKHDIDIREQPIPVVPAAHYLCGGVKVNLDGQTSLDKLYAIGESSCTGVHGANRLASTALLECLTWGHKAADSIAARLQQHELLGDEVTNALQPWRGVGDGSGRLNKQRIAGDWGRIRNTMWNYVGIRRSNKLLEIAAKDFHFLRESLSDLYFNTSMSKELVDLFHGMQACQIIVEAARKDQKSIGCHYLVE